MPLRTTVRRQSQLFTTSGYFTVPPGVFRIFAALTGAGGGGGGNFGSGNQRGPGGGGGAGQAISRRPIDVTPGQQIYITIGAGGDPGTSGNAGSAGGTTSVGAYYSAPGGSGGQPGVGASQGGAGGQAGGPASSHGGSSWSEADATTYAPVGGAPGPIAQHPRPSGGSISPYGTGGAGAVGNMAAAISGTKGGDGLVIIDW